MMWVFACLVIRCGFCALAVVLNGPVNRWSGKLYKINLMNRVHLTPADDLREHVESGIDCSCAPSIQQKGALVVHNAFDGREFWGRWDHYLTSEVNSERTCQHETERRNTTTRNH